jgi:DNA invertase Pin-like site-specific DNA recombinase
MENTYQGQKAVIYARYSSHNQTEQSIEGQLRDCYQFAERNGIVIVNEYIDRAQSGTKDDRPAFQKMIQDSEKKQFTLVLVWKLDRFARNRYDAANYKHILKKHGAKLVSVMEPISDDPTGVLIEAVLEGSAEYYSRNLSQNIRRGLRESIMKGWFPGGHIPFGYLHQNHKLVPDPKNAPIVKEIFQRYVNGELPTVILADLNSRGVTFHNGRVFKVSSLAHVLENPTYTGNYYYGGQFVEDCATPLIDQELFDQAAIRRAENRHAPAASRTEDVRFILLGKLFCGECGSNMSGDGGTSSIGVYHHYYTCRKKKKDRNACDSKTLRKYDIEYLICKVISDFILNKKRRTLQIMADCIADAYQDEFETSEVSDLEKQLKRIEHDLAKLIDSLIEMPESARPMIAERMDKLTNQKMDVEIRLAKKRMDLNDTFSKEDFLRCLQKSVENPTDEVNREFIINKFLNSAYVYNDGHIVIYLNKFRGMPSNIYGIDTDPKPGKDDFESGVKIFEGKIPEEIAALPDFRAGSTLVTYAPPNADKLEPRLPHLFFLHQRIGIVVWYKDIRR